jgi:hypothetical protein
MKNIFFSLCFFSSIALTSQNKVGYHYDNNGNRDQRFFVGLRPSHPNTPSQIDSLLNTLGQMSNTVTAKDPQTVAMDHGITAYPNPTKDLIMVSVTKAGVKESKKAIMYLVDNNGRIVDTKNYTGSEISFDLSKNPPGTYYLKVIFDDQSTLVYNVIKVN